MVLFALKSYSQEVENGPDFSDIDSIEKAIDLYEKGELSKIYMMPLEFGGEDIPANTLYVPGFVQDFKEGFDGTVEKLLLDGKIISFEAKPEYKGRSFIPSKLKLEVSGDAEFIESINIW
ncbi:hypothetical protein EQY75_05230 [Muriicola soli]|uniref:Uncharacterized protein n=1 Tax=Muriicola soli TaxID=2507538 RepID=A0A411ECX6_9FLAO|nr:hypothetical protein EQY75_05230 [Muriicola soli]